MDEKQRAQIMAEQNDTFRQWWMEREGEPEVPGRALLTEGVQALLLDEAKETQELLNLIAAPCDFGEDNDPWGERDFGAFDFCGERLFWKIDLFTDDAMIRGSEEPTNLEKTYRVMTIMLSSEY